MRILLLRLGTRGDVQPFVALGRELRGRGHDVSLCTCCGMAPFVEGHGLRYAHLNNDILDLANSETGRGAMSETGALGSLRRMVRAARLSKPMFRRTLAEEWKA